MVTHVWPAALGTAVRDRRHEIGLSQEALADTCRLHRTYIGSVERGERNVSLENIVRIADALDIQPSELIGRAERLVTLIPGGVQRGSGEP